MAFRDVAATAASFVALRSVAALCRRGVLVRPLQRLGRGSLEVYVLQTYLLHHEAAVALGHVSRPPADPRVWAAVVAPVAAVAVCAALLAAGAVIDRFPPLSGPLLGRFVPRRPARAADQPPAAAVSAAAT